MTKEEATYNDGAVYNCLDAVSRVSTEYGAECEERAIKHSKKAYRGILLTIGGSLIGLLYTLIHFKAASYYSGASDVYGKYNNLIDDADEFEEEWISIAKAKKEKKDN